MSGLLGLLEPKTLRWISYCTVVAVAVGAVFAVAVFSLTKYEQREFRCYTTLSSQPTRVKAIEDDCYQKYDHQYNKVSLATLITCVSLFEIAVGLVTFVYTRYAIRRVNQPKENKYGLCKAYVWQLVIRAVMLLVLLCLQWTVMTSRSFPEKHLCHPTQPDHGPSRNITGLAANASTSTRTYSCENPNAIAKSVSGGLFFVINLLAFLCSVGEMADLIKSWYKEWPSDKDFCAKYRLGERDNESATSSQSEGESEDDENATSSQPQRESEGGAQARQSTHEVSDEQERDDNGTSSQPQGESNRVEQGGAQARQSTHEVSDEQECNKASFGKLPQTLENQVAELESTLKQQYERRDHIFVTPFPWLDNWKLALDSIFIKVQMKERSPERFRELKGDIRGMHTIFEAHQHCLEPRTVLVEGEPGSGKTVFCQRLATDWSRNKTGESFPRFRIFLKLACRDIVSKSGDLDVEALEASICDQLLPLNASDELKKALFEYIKSTQCEALLVLDGLDELKRKVDLPRLIDAKLSPLQCKFLMTSRNDETLRHHFDSLFQIVGFGLEDAKSYIKKFFEDREEMGDHLIDEIEGERVEEDEENGVLLRDLVTNPLTTSLLCFVFNETDGKLPSSKAKLYEELACCVLRRKYKKNGQEPPEDPLATHQEDLALLGRLALKGIEKGQLHFQEHEFKAEGCATDVLDFGFLTKEKSTSKLINSPCCHQFVHKTLQEFFAALYLCVELLSADSENCLRRLGRISDGELLRQYKQVFLFLSSMLSEKGEQGKPAASRFFSSLARRECDDGGEFGRLIVDLLHECASVDAEFGEAMIQRIVDSWAVKQLNLSNRRMSEADVRFRVACAVVKANRPLERLYLNRNNIRDLSRLAGALQTNSSLRGLMLASNPLTAETVGAVAASLVRQTGLEMLYLEVEFMEEPAVKNLQDKKPQLDILPWTLSAIQERLWK